MLKDCERIPVFRVRDEKYNVWEKKRENNQKRKQNNRQNEKYAIKWIRLRLIGIINFDEIFIK